MDGHERTDSEYVKENYLPKGNIHWLSALFHRGCGRCLADRVCAHPGIYSHSEKHSDGRNLPNGTSSGRSVCGCAYPLFIVSLASIIKRVFRIPWYTVWSARFSQVYYLCLWLIAASRISMYVGLYVFFMALFAAGTAIYMSSSAYVFSTNCLTNTLHILPVLLKDYIIRCFITG